MRIARTIAAASLALIAAAPALAHEEAGDKDPPKVVQTAPEAQGTHDMHDMDMQSMPGMDHSEHAGHAAAPAPVDADDTPGDAPPPPVPTDHPADRYSPAVRMDAARAALASEGRFTGGALMIDQFEYRAKAGADGYAWKATGWYGGDIDRAVLAAEGEGEFGGPAERAEVRLMWRRALAPYFNLEAGVRHDFRPDPERTYVAIGFEALAPYWFEVESQLFVSNKGDAHLRLGGSHDMRLSGPLVLQPEAEVNVAFQDVPELGIGSGVERLELGARLRYEFRPDFAPYVGVHWERKFGGSADFAHAEGERASAVSAVIGLRAWF